MKCVLNLTSFPILFLPVICFLMIIHSFCLTIIPGKVNPRALAPWWSVCHLVRPSATPCCCSLLCIPPLSWLWLVVTFSLTMYYGGHLTLHPTTTTSSTSSASVEFSNTENKILVFIKILALLVKASLCTVAAVQLRRSHTADLSPQINRFFSFLTFITWFIYILWIISDWNANTMSTDTMIQIDFP